MDFHQPGGVIIVVLLSQLQDELGLPTGAQLHVLAFVKGAYPLSHGDLDFCFDRFLQPLLDGLCLMIPIMLVKHRPPAQQACVDVVMTTGSAVPPVRHLADSQGLGHPVLQLHVLLLEHSEIADALLHNRDG